ncbi:MAG: ABC transporter permease [Vicinamibacteria bacterium]
MTIRAGAGRLGLVSFLARRSLAQHALTTVVTAACVALGVGLVLAVLGISRQAEDAFTGGEAGFDAVLGARGSALQLVLNTVFHLETSPGNIPWSLYEAVRADPGVALAVPYAVGDNYRGFRIVGTTREMLDSFEYRAGRRFEAREGGRFFDPERREAVLGSEVARRSGLAEGSTFNPYHGLATDESQRHPEEYVVVGVLEPTNSPSDRVLWIPIEGVFRMSGHVLRGTGTQYQARPGEAIPAEHREVSAVMLKLRSPQAGFALSQTINRQGKVATLAWPVGRVMAELFDRIGWVTRVLAFVAWLVMLVAAGSVLASLYGSMAARRRDVAILRALGAGRATVFAAVVTEAALLSAAGAVGGLTVYGVTLAVARSLIRAQTGVLLDPFVAPPGLVAVPLAAVGLGAVAGVLPAVLAYRTDVASHLTAES